MKRTFFWILVALCLACVNIFALTTTASAAPVQQQSSNPQIYRIGFVNVHTGKLSYWTTSSYVQWSQRKLQEEHLRGFSPSLSVSPNLYRVPGCSAGRNDFYDLENGFSPPVCFARAGDTGSINVYCVYEVWTGNNTGWFQWNNLVGNSGTDPTPSKYTPYYAVGDGTGGCGNNEFADITWVHIN